MSFGVIVRTRLSPPTGGPAVNTGTLLLAGQAASGTAGEVVECRGIDDWAAAFGPRTGLSVASYDYLDTYFREAGFGARAFFAKYGTDPADAWSALTDPKQYGPGQLAVCGAGAAPGATLYSDMQNLAMSTNRVALRDVGPTDSIAEMEAAGDLAPDNDDYGATFGPWVTVPAPAGVFGVGSRQVPASAIIAALCNRVDQNGNPNRAAAGDDYPLQYATGFALEPSDVDRAGLFEHGVNAFGTIYNVLENYGFQTNIPQGPDNPYWQFNASRGRMYLKAKAEVRGQHYMFKNIDGQGHLAAALGGDIEHECKMLWDLDGLYGATPQDAYSVNVIQNIANTAEGTLTATATVCWSMHTKLVEIDLVTVPVGSSVNA